MNKLLAKTILGVIIFSLSFLSLSCKQSTVNDIRPPTTPIAIISSSTATVTVTPIPCYPKAPTTDLEKTAETWFLSSVPNIPERSNYELLGAGVESWGYFCSYYQDLLLKNDQTAYSPIEISLRVITESSSQNYYQMDSVIVAAVNSRNLAVSNVEGLSSRDIVTVVVSRPYIDVQFETRIDYVFENGIWQFRWLGTRWKCLNVANADWEKEKLDCP